MLLPTLAGLALSTFVSEDLASIGAGLLARDGHLPLAQAIAACVIGVYVGDLGLWCAGRLLGRRALMMPWLARRLDPAALEALSARIDRRLGAAVVISRFVPGGRLPMYVAAGIWGRRPLAFAAWSLLAVLAWTPLLVAGTAVFGDAVVGPLLRGMEAGVLGSVLTGLAAWGLFTLAGRAAGIFARRYHHRLAQTIDTPI